MAPTRIEVLKELVHHQQDALARVDVFKRSHHFFEGVLVVQLLVSRGERVRDAKVGQKLLQPAGDDLAQGHLQTTHLDTQHLELASDRRSGFGHLWMAKHRGIRRIFGHQRQHQHQVGLTGTVVADDQHTLVVDGVVEADLRNHELGTPLGHVIGNDIGCDELLCLIGSPGIEQLNDRFDLFELDQITVFHFVSHVFLVPLVSKSRM